MIDRKLSVFFTLLLALLTAGGCKYVSELMKPTRGDNLIAESVQVTAEWQEFNVKGKVVPEGNYNYISIELEKPFRTMSNTDTTAVAGPDGKGFVPEVKLIDEQGKEYPLDVIRTPGETRIIHSGYSMRIPRDIIYTKLMIRSSVPFTAKKISWIYVV